VAIATLCLGGVHRDVGATQQLVSVTAVGGPDRDPDARAGDDLTIAKVERRDQGLKDARGGLRGFVRIGLLDDDRELVAAQPSDGVAGPGRGPQPVADGDQQAVALSVAQPVVDGLEVVEVQVQDRSRQRTPGCAREGVPQAVAEERAVGQPGQDIVERLMTELLLERLALGDVTVVDHHAADRRVVEQVLGDRLERPPRAVRVQDAELERRLGAAGRSDIGESSLDRGAIIGMGLGRQRLTETVVGPPAEDALDGRALVADQAVLAEHEHAVRCVAHERAEPFLAALQIDKQKALGGGLLVQTPVLGSEHPRRATECQPDEGGEHARGDECHDEHARADRRHPLLDEARVLVHVVDADGIAVDRATDRDEQLEVAPGDGRQALRVGDGRSLRDGIAVAVLRDTVTCVGAGEQRPDRESPSAERGVVRIHDPPISRPDVDSADLTGQHQSFELGVDGGVVPRLEVEARLVHDGIDVAPHDRLDVMDRGFLGSLAQLVRDAIRYDHGHADDDRDRRCDDDHADARPPADPRGRSREHVSQLGNGHGAGGHRTNVRCAEP
jgi:hypothetical protein